MALLCKVVLPFESVDENTRGRIVIVFSNRELKCYKPTPRPLCLTNKLFSLYKLISAVAVKRDTEYFFAFCTLMKLKTTDNKIKQLPC